jgi:hypothetical protein
MNQNIARVRTTPTVELKAVTWNKDSHGLFDYENNQYEMKKFQISHPVKIYRINNDIIPTTKDEIPTHENHKTEFLLSISQDALAKEKFFINVAPQFPATDIVSLAPNPNLYLIVRSLKAVDGKNQRGYAVSPGDIIKLGRIEYRVTECQVGVDTLSVKKITDAIQEDADFFDASTQRVPQDVSELCCKYCLAEDCCPDKNSIDNKLLFPCKCTGSTGGVHF